MPPQAADQHGASLDSLCADLAADRHVIVASNRGPVSFSGHDGSPSASSDAAVSGLSPLRGRLTITWVSAASSGPDRAVAEQAGNGLITRGLPDGWSARFIMPSRRAYHRFYNVICNPLLWFLHHRSWGFTHTPNIDREAQTAWEQGMVPVSRMFAEEIAKEADRARRPVAVFLRGYHMQLAGGMVRELLPGAVIHCMVDVPWPDPSDWLMLPGHWRSALLESMLACDVAGVGSRRDARNLLSCFEEFMPDAQIDRSAGTVTGGSGRVTAVRSYPTSTDHDALMAASASRRTRSYVEDLRDERRHTFVTAERVEPHKNIVRCIRAYGSMLDRTPTLAERARYLLVLAPPPPHLSQYRRYLSEVESAAKEVNRKHGTRSGPVVNLVVENNYSMALAAMEIADTLVAAPISDAACSTVAAAPLVNTRNCSLIVSETSVAAELFAGAAALVSPADVEAIANEMRRAVERPDGEREKLFSNAESVALGLSAGSTTAAQVADLLTASRRS